MLLCIHGNTERGDTMKRDMKKIIEQTKVPNGYQLACSEWLQLSHHAARGGADDALDATLEAFTYGFALGMRYLKNKKAPVKRQGRA